MSVNEQSALLSHYERWLTGRDITGYSLKRRQRPSGTRSRSPSPAENTLALLLRENKLELWSEAGEAALAVQNDFLSLALSQQANGSANLSGGNRRMHTLSERTVAAAVQEFERSGLGGNACFPIILGHARGKKLELRQPKRKAPSSWPTLSSLRHIIRPSYVNEYWRDYSLFLLPEENASPRSTSDDPYPATSLGWNLRIFDVSLSKGTSVRRSDPLSEERFKDLLQWRCSEAFLASLNTFTKILRNHREKGCHYYVRVVLKVEIPRDSASPKGNECPPGSVSGTILDIGGDPSSFEHVALPNGKWAKRYTPYHILPAPEPSDS